MHECFNAFKTIPFEIFLILPHLFKIIDDFLKYLYGISKMMKKLNYRRVERFVSSIIIASYDTFLNTLSSFDYLWGSTNSRPWNIRMKGTH
jgi:hypothetical protein